MNKAIGKTEERRNRQEELATKIKELGEGGGNRVGERGNFKGRVKGGNTGVIEEDISHIARSVS